MPLESALDALGLKIDRWDPTINQELFSADALVIGSVSGGALGDIPAFFKASEHVIRITALLATPVPMAGECRCRIYDKLLKLNFNMPFGRFGVGVPQTPVATGQSENLLFVETMFFWRHSESNLKLFQDEVKQRLNGLVKMYLEGRKIIDECSSN